MYIDLETYLFWKHVEIPQIEDEWNGKYKTFGEMWDGEGYAIIEPINYE